MLIFWSRKNRMYFWRSFGMALALHVSLWGAVLWLIQRPLPQKKVVEEKPMVLSIQMFKVEPIVSQDETIIPLPLEKPKPMKAVKKIEPSNKPIKSVDIQPKEPLVQVETTEEKPLHVKMETTPKVNPLDVIYTVILAHKSYPKRAQRMGIEGEVVVYFLWSKRGVENMKIEKSSGHSLLDSHCFEIVTLASKDFPMVDEPLEVSVPIAFRFINL